MKLTSFELARCEPDEWPAGDADWLPTSVPSGVHEVLIAAGRIPHPYFGVNEDELQWVEQTWWCYRSTLDVPQVNAAADRWLLIFHGLDGPAEVRIAGKVRAAHNNQHRPLVIDVTDQAGTAADIQVRFRPALADQLPADKLRTGVDALVARWKATRAGAELPPRRDLLARVARTHVRKAAFSWGWDFAPRLASAGIHRAVTLDLDQGLAVKDAQIRTIDVDPSARTAVISVTPDIDERAGRIDRLRLTVLRDGAELARHDLEAAGAKSLQLNSVDAWWPHDLGEPNLYDVRIDALRDDSAVQSWQHTVGFRTIELNLEPDTEGGQTFQFRVNGVPLFARGANWVPASMFVASIPPETYERSVAAARHAGMNMLRVWGGGIYEAASFYEACDRAGIMVWQDFMFACDDYPSDDPAFRDEVRREATHQVRRLRNHACLALWAGNNEVQAIHQLVGGDLSPGDWGWELFHELLPAVVGRESPGTSYWPGSPWGSLDATVNGVHDGDRHAWEVWHGLTNIGVEPESRFATQGEAAHFRRYADDRGRFISEFGIHAAPEESTLRRWLPTDQLALHSPALLHHIKDDPKDKGWALIEEEVGRPTELSQYVEFSMACQAEGLKFGVEHYRRRQPICNGTLVWQFNDPWPGLSWSVLDYELTPKAGYWFLQRAYQPVIASFDVDHGELVLWVTNSGADAVELDLEIDLVDLDGTTHIETEIPCSAPAFSSQPVWRGALPQQHTVPWVVERNDLVPANRRLLSPLKMLPFAGSVSAEARTNETGVEVEITSVGYSYFTRATLDGPGPLPSTNYLDLRNGERALVTFPGLGPDDIPRISVTSWGQPARSVEGAYLGSSER